MLLFSDGPNRKKPARLIAAKLDEVKGWDPVLLCGAMVTLGLRALVASLVPARGLLR